MNNLFAIVYLQMQLVIGNYSSLKICLKELDEMMGYVKVYKTLSTKAQTLTFRMKLVKDCVHVLLLPEGWSST